MMQYIDEQRMCYASPLANYFWKYCNQRLLHPAGLYFCNVFNFPVCKPLSTKVSKLSSYEKQGMHCMHSNQAAFVTDYTVLPLGGPHQSPQWHSFTAYSPI